MKQFFFFIFVCSFQHLKAQQFTVKSITEANPNKISDIYKFPWLEGNTAISKEINTTLLLAQLEMKYGKEQISIFENIWETKEYRIPIIYNLDYKIHLLNEKIYALTISGESCGAYCEYFEMPYLFDLSDGSQITIEKLFTEKGQKLILAHMKAIKGQQIQTQLKLARDSLSSVSSIDEKEYYTDMIELYEYCDYNYDNIAYFKFIPIEDGFKLIGSRCSAHYNRNVDELWNLEVTFEYSEWETTLTDYSQTLFIKD